MLLRLVLCLLLLLLLCLLLLGLLLGLLLLLQVPSVRKTHAGGMASQTRVSTNAKTSRGIESSREA